MDETIKNILIRLYDAGGCDALDRYSAGWDDAISESIKIVKEEANKLSLQAGEKV